MTETPPRWETALPGPLEEGRPIVIDIFPEEGDHLGDDRARRQLAADGRTGVDRDAVAAELRIGLHAHRHGVAELQFARAVGVRAQDRTLAQGVPRLDVDPRAVAGHLDPARYIDHDALARRGCDERPQRLDPRGAASQQEGRCENRQGSASSVHRAIIADACNPGVVPPACPGKTRACGRQPVTRTAVGGILRRMEPRPGAAPSVAPS